MPVVVLINRKLHAILFSEGTFALVIESLSLLHGEVCRRNVVFIVKRS